MGPTSAEARALTKEAEAVATVAHAIYKEHVYLLADCYVTRQWLNRRALKQGTRTYKSFHH
ncbi:MAG: hypothetical protein QXG17_07925 [Sulfolobales archaeon]